MPLRRTSLRTAVNSKQVISPAFPIKDAGYSPLSAPGGCPGSLPRAYFPILDQKRSIPCFDDLHGHDGYRRDVKEASGNCRDNLSSKSVIASRHTSGECVNLRAQMLARSFPASQMQCPSRPQTGPSRLHSHQPSSDRTQSRCPTVFYSIIW